jgi:hypothetical protein
VPRSSNGDRPGGDPVSAAAALAWLFRTAQRRKLGKPDTDLIVRWHSLTFA